VTAFVDTALSGVFGFRGHSNGIDINLKEALDRLRDPINRPLNKERQFIPGIDQTSPVERSSGFLFIRFLEGFKSTHRTIVEEHEDHFITKRVKVHNPIHNHIVDAVLFAKGTVNDRWFFVQGTDLGDAFGRLNRYLHALGYLDQVNVSSFSGIAHQEAIVQDILATLYFDHEKGGRVSGIKIAGKRYNVMGTRVRYSGDFDLRRSEFSEEINEKVRIGEKIESLTLELSRSSVPSSIGGRIPIFTIRNDLRISSRSKINDRTIKTAIALSKLLEEYKREFVQESFDVERRLVSRSLVSLENFL